MIQFNFNLKWNGPIIISRMQREIKQAVAQGAMRVQRAAKDPLLNRSGKSQTARSGINKGTLAERWNRGVGGMRGRGLNIINLGPTQLAFGGIHRYQNRANPNHIYQMERIYWYGEPLHRWVQSSFPGTAPHKQTGHLQRSIVVERVNDGMRAKVGPAQGLRYGRMQELGGRTRFGTLPPRPYMAPALAMTQSAILQDFYRAVARATK